MNDRMERIYDADEQSRPNTKSHMVFSEDQYQAAIAFADKDTAMALWKDGDWVTYQTIRMVLLSLMRTGRAREVGIHGLQFIYFVNASLMNCLNIQNSDREIFMRKASMICGRAASI